MAQNPLGEKICTSLLLKGPTLVDASSSTYSSQRESMECRHAVLPYRRTSPPLRLSVARADAVRSTVIGQANSRTDQGLGVAIPQLANIILRSGNVMGFAPRQTMLARRKTFVHCGCLQECGALHFTSTDLNNDGMDKAFVRPPYVSVGLLSQCAMRLEYILCSYKSVRFDLYTFLPVLQHRSPHQKNRDSHLPQYLLNLSQYRRRLLQSTNPRPSKSKTTR